MALKRGALVLKIGQEEMISSCPILLLQDYKLVVREALIRNFEWRFVQANSQSARIDY